MFESGRRIGKRNGAGPTMRREAGAWPPIASYQFLFSATSSRSIPRNGAGALSRFGHKAMIGRDLVVAQALAQPRENAAAPQMHAVPAEPPLSRRGQVLIHSELLHAAGWAAL